MNGDGLTDLVGARSRPTSGSVFLVSGSTSLPSEMWLQDATARLDVPPSRVWEVRYSIG